MTLAEVPVEVLRAWADAGIISIHRYIELMKARKK